jgi:aryl-alcohol dehydrogenase-like predicted oxidoreductase
MKYRLLGRRTGLRVSEIGLGAWGLGGAVRLPEVDEINTYGDVSDEEAQAVLEVAFDSGINLVDTAPWYGAGRSEERIGRALEGREGIIVVSKVGEHIAETGRTIRDFSPRGLLQQFDASRRRLGRDVIDVDLLHSPSPAEYGSGEGLDALHELKAAGKARFVGVSVGADADLTRAFFERADVDVLEVPLNLLLPEAAALLPVAQARGIGVIARVPLASGLLSGQITRDTVFGPDDRRRLWTRQYLESRLARVEQVAFLWADGQRTPAQAALQWVLSHAGVSTVIAGATATAEVRENVAVPDLPPLAAAALARVRAVHGLEGGGATTPAP